MQNIDLMNLAGFCRNCLSNWLKDAADERGVPLSKEDSRTQVYGMPYEEWKARHQNEAEPSKLAAFDKGSPTHSREPRAALLPLAGRSWRWGCERC